MEPGEREKPSADAKRRDPRAIARRRLLRIAIYTPPAIVGTLLLSRDAHAQSTTCQPYQCKPNPCDPRPCEPAGCHPNLCKPNPPP